MGKDIDLLVLSEPVLSRCFYFRILLALDSWVSRKESFLLDAKRSPTLFPEVNSVRLRKFRCKDLLAKRGFGDHLMKCLYCRDREIVAQRGEGFLTGQSD